MARRAASKVRGLIKHHGRTCERRKDGNSIGNRPDKDRPDPCDCSCPWWAKYKHAEVSLSKWSGQDVPPHVKGPASKVLARLIVAVDNGTFSPVGETLDNRRDGQSLAEFIAQWTLEWAAERGLSMDSAASMLRVIEHGLGRYPLRWLTDDKDGSLTIERWLNAAQKERGWSDQNWNKYREMIGRLFNRAMKWKRVKANPVAFIDRKVAVRRETGVRIGENAEDRLFAACDQLDEVEVRRNRTALTWPQVETIRQRAEAGDLQKDLAMEFGVSRTTVSQVVNRQVWNRDRAESYSASKEMRRRLIGAFDLGLRRTEMLHVTVAMVELTPLRTEIDGVQHEVLEIRLPGKITKGSKRTGKEECVYAGTDRVKAMLLERVAQLTDHPLHRQYVFGREDGSQVRSFDRSWRRLFQLAGLQWGRDNNLVWHTLRHEYVSRTLEKTKDPLVAQLMARHKDAETTQTYLHARPTKLLEAAVLLNRESTLPFAARSPSDAASADRYARAMPEAKVVAFRPDSRKVG